MIQKFGHSHAVHERWYKVFMSKGNDKFLKFEKAIIDLVKIKSGKRLIASSKKSLVCKSIKMKKQKCF